MPPEEVELENPLEALLNDEPVEDPVDDPDAETALEEEPVEEAPAEEEDPRFAALERELAAGREREERLIALVERTQGPAKPTADEEINLNAVIDEHFEGASKAGLEALVSALETRIEKRMGANLQRVEASTAHVAIEAQERRVQASYADKGVPEADLKEAHTRIYAQVKKAGKPLWDSPESAYRDVLNDMMIEKQYKKADAAALRSANVRARQAKGGAPATSAPTGVKATLDVKKLRAEKGRSPTTMEIIAAMDDD